MIKAPTLRERWSQLYESLFKSKQILEYYQNYIDFTAQPLSLGQFVACNSKGEPMEKPKHKNPGHSTFEMHQVQEYQKAVDRVIFTGWECDKFYDDGSGARLVYDDTICILETPSNILSANGNYCKTIEDLITSVELHLKDNDLLKTHKV